LNESASSDTTPCLAWDLLYTEREMIWGCEADTVSMLTKFIVHRCLRVPVMMTNLYPFLMGQAALQHERIPAFPQVDDPANYVLAAHCGYLGILPANSLSSGSCAESARDCGRERHRHRRRLSVGELTLVKLGPTFDTLSVVEAELTGYAGFLVPTA